MLPVNPFIPLQPAAETQLPAGAPAGFGEVLKKAIADVDRLQKEADEAARRLVLGEAQDVHQVMIAMEQARLAMQLTVQVRNKVIEAYQEISRMQI